MVKVTLGATLNLGGYNSARVEITAEGETYEAAIEEAQRLFYRTGYDHCKELTVGIKSPNIVDWLASKMDTEPM